MLSDQYIAGFFDGEGCVSIRARRPRQRGTVTTSLAVDIGNTEVGILLMIQERFGGYLTRNRGCNRPVHVLRLRGVKTFNFLLAVQPYAIVKADQIAIALEYWRFQHGADKDRYYMKPSPAGHGAQKTKRPETIATEFEFKRRLHELKGPASFRQKGQLDYWTGAVGVTASTLM